jgi:hypothetical protein
LIILTKYQIWWKYSAGADWASGRAARAVSYVVDKSH